MILIQIFSIPSLVTIVSNTQSSYHANLDSLQQQWKTNELIYSCFSLSVQMSFSTKYALLCLEFRTTFSKKQLLQIFSELAHKSRLERLTCNCWCWCCCCCWWNCCTCWKASWLWCWAPPVGSPAGLRLAWGADGWAPMMAGAPLTMEAGEYVGTGYGICAGPAVTIPMTGWLGWGAWSILFLKGILSEVVFWFKDSNLWPLWFKFH